MIQTTTKEWQIAKAYIYDVASQDGMINLDWDDFQALADSHRPLMAVKVDGDVAVDELLTRAMNEIQAHCPPKPSGFIVSFAYNEGEEIMMDEMSGINDCMDNLFDEAVDIRWGIAKKEGMESKRCVCVFAFE